MKKIKMFMAFCIALLSVVFAESVVFAKNGDVIGKIYSTDIIAKIDGLNAPSYNIGGKTAIVIEELADESSSLNYAIRYKYDDKKRLLDVTMSSSGGFWGEQYDEIKRGKVGKIVGNVYETDIRVCFNGYEIEGINIGGRTAVIIEDLGRVGGINEEFGYSKYRCKATWMPEEKIIALNFIDDNKTAFSVFDYGNFLKYRIDDNVMTAEFDRMAIAHSEVAKSNLSKEFKEDVNVLKPLYFDDGKEKTEVGFVYMESDTVDDLLIHKMYITKPDVLKQITDNIHDGKTPSPEEAFKFLDDKVNYETLQRDETEDFYLLTVKDLKAEDVWNDLSYVLVKKTGGYGKVYSGSTYYKDRVVKKTGKNIVKIGEGPTADPHGKPAMLYCELNLNNYFVR